jgi:purine/pyrimidine-nucleoside phosphorylase
MSTQSPQTIPQEFKGVTALTRATIYFGGKIVAHTIFAPDGTKKTLGLVYPGRFHFLTDDLATRMEIVAGECHVKFDGQNNWEAHSIKKDFVFEVPSRSGFEIEVRGGICEYVCTFIKP